MEAEASCRLRRRLFEHGTQTALQHQGVVPERRAHRHRLAGVGGRRRERALPAVDDRELDRHPVLAVPALVGERERIGDELELIGRDVVDVLLDDHFEDHHDHDVARRLEEALVVPARVGACKQVADTVVLAQAQHVHHHVADLNVRTFHAHREQLRPLRGLQIAFLAHRCVESVELRLDPVGRRIVVELRILLAVDRLALELAAGERPQHRGRLRRQPVHGLRSM
ncbi:MAG TPA: hypothetical protein VIW69_13320, partial [Candidatus Elarobacter sp.]